MEVAETRVGTRTGTEDVECNDVIVKGGERREEG